MEATKSLENSLVGDPDNVEYHKLLYQIFSKLGIEDKEEFHQAKYKSLIE
jgi:Tfp pilus assembly protein PilF